MEWERGLVRAWELLTKCKNPSCERGFFIWDGNGTPVCPFCGTKVTSGVIRFCFYSEVHTNPGEYRPLYAANITDNTPLFTWHFTTNVYPDEKTDRTLMAYVMRHDGEWYLVNSRVHGLKSPDGRIIPPGRACRLYDGALLHTRDGVIIRVQDGLA
jgi:hypothetical protein